MVLGYCCGSTGAGKEKNKPPLLGVNERESARESWNGEPIFSKIESRV